MFSMWTCTAAPASPWPFPVSVKACPNQIRIPPSRLTSNSQTAPSPTLSNQSRNQKSIIQTRNSRKSENPAKTFRIGRKDAEEGHFGSSAREDSSVYRKMKLALPCVGAPALEKRIAKNEKRFRGLLRSSGSAIYRIIYSVKIA